MTTFSVTSHLTKSSVNFQIGTRSDWNSHDKNKGDPQVAHSPVDWQLISHFHSPQPDTSWHCEFPGSKLVNRGNVPVVAAVQRCSSFLATRRGISRLSRPRATVSKFPDHINYAVTRVSAAGSNHSTIQLRIHHATTRPLRPRILRAPKVNKLTHKTYPLPFKLQLNDGREQDFVLTDIEKFRANFNVTTLDPFLSKFVATQALQFNCSSASVVCNPAHH